MDKKTVIVWLNQDLRIEDNLALYHACKNYDFVIILYLLESTLEKELGHYQRWWLYHSLNSFNQTLSKKYKNKLIFFKDNSHQKLTALIKKQAVGGIYWNRSYMPHDIIYEKLFKKLSKTHKIELQSFNSHLLIDPTTLLNKSGQYFKVYKAFCRAASKPLRQLKTCPAFHIKRGRNVKSDTLKKIILPLEKKAQTKFNVLEKPSEALALKQWKNFMHKKLKKYASQKDYPANQKTSRMSAYLHFGQVSPRHMLKTLKKSTNRKGSQALIDELLWREFSYYILYHFPKFPKTNFNAHFNQFRWNKKPSQLKKWQQGLTGYPIIDAGMRELMETGFMHNRVRMIVASFLIKDLLIHWRYGAAWFLKHLFDADLANNSMGWQWVAGSGPNAAPFFRIFNPMLQSEKFDRDGLYIKKWIPSLKDLDAKWIHQPWNAPLDVLKKAKVKIGLTYPKPIVDHIVASKKAMQYYKKL
jgi:deoxyribodipyrimidine photo-lyase